MAGSFANGINPDLIKRALEQERQAGVAPKKSRVKPPCRPFSSPETLPPGTLVLSVVLPGEGVSVNAAYFNVPGKGRVATPALNDWKLACASALLLPEHAQPAPRQRYRLDLTLYGDWEKEDGMPRKRDSANYEKADSDIICKYLGVDDCWIYEHRIVKIHDLVWPRHVVRLATI